MSIDTNVSGGGGGTRNATVETGPGMSTVTGRTLTVLGAGRAADLAFKLRARRVAQAAANPGGDR